MAVDGQRFMTKTQHYRKVTKPLLERKRRARMNLYLDELKDLIVDTMEAQGEHVAKLEKADILEMTVNYLKSQKQMITTTTNPTSTVALPGTGLNVEKFRAGYTQAAYEVSKLFATVPGLDLKFGSRLMKHLGYQLKDMQSSLPPPSCNGNIKPFMSHMEYVKLRNVKNGDDIDMVPLKLQEQQEVKGDNVWRPW